jgi:microsomal dipeptidase-like Zn-dependent dipeptidase
VKHGYTDDDIAKAIGGNTLFVLEQAWIRWTLGTSGWES